MYEIGRYTLWEEVETLSKKKYQIITRGYNYSKLFYFSLLDYLTFHCLIIY